MPALHFPAYPVRLRQSGARTEVFDIVRRRWFVLTPEEWVRQHVLHYLITDKNYPASLLAVEKSISVNNLRKRCDVVAFGTDARPLLVVECKAPDVTISQHTFDQIARYNLTLGVNLLLVTNGMQHYCCRMNHETQEYVFLKELPEYLH
ncbi:MAG: type I restriction enzyme HsdR N-terminal domain-containing protein [Bacteroidia bacterium]|nr:type I restriction enzyme HsdR N-terminal domain-containing protein [Bacteroidia bacterium]